MQIVLDETTSTNRSVLALGMFDGVHFGHRMLLHQAGQIARAKKVPLVVCTFQQHPLQVIAPEKCPPMLSTFEERNRLMEELGVDMLCAIPFTREVMEMPPEEYVKRLVHRFHPVAVVCGYNHTFGRKGQGNPALLRELGETLGFQTVIVPKVTVGGHEVSSTVIRRLLAQGDPEQALLLLNRPYELRAQLTARRGNTCWIQLISDGKQTLAPSAYRVFLCDLEHAYPALLHTGADGSARCFLPRNAPLENELCLQFWTSAWQ